MNEICKNIREELTLEGRAPEDATIREHLASCEECSRFLERVSAMEREIRALPERNVSDDVVARLLARPELARSKKTSWRTWAIAVAAAASVAFLAFLLPAYREEQTSSRRADLASQPSKEVRRYDPGSGARQQDMPRDSAANHEPLDTFGGAMPSPPPEGIPGGIPSEPAMDDKRLVAQQEGFASGGKLERKDSVDSLEKKQDVEKAMPRLSRVPARELNEAQAQRDPGDYRELDGGRASGLALFADEVHPEKRVDRAPVVPDIARQAHVEGTVLLEVVVDKEGNVVQASVVRSIPVLDQAALDAVRQWKYVPTESDELRRFHVSVPFRLSEFNKPDDSKSPKRPDEESAFSLLKERRRVDDVPFRQATGYWANTYIAGDPWLRQLEARLRRFPVESYGAPAMALHRIARPAPLLLDPSSKAALAVFVHADRAGITEKSRLLVQVGIQAREQHGRRRPPMNVAVVLHTAAAPAAAEASSIRAFLDSLETSREPGDRFRLIVAGPLGGEVLTPETFRHGPLTVALQDLFTRGASSGTALGPKDAMALALQRVLEGDDPNAPLGTSLVILATTERLGAQVEPLRRMASHAAVGGVTVSAVAIGDGAQIAETERIALAGHGRVYGVASATDAPRVVDGELSAAGRTVARAVRLRIQLAEGVRLVDVLGSERLDARETERVRAEEKSIDVRLARNLGIEADRGDDEDGIQIVLPSFYAGDAHSILLDVVADRPGPIAEVTARYKDLVQLENTVARASLALARKEAAPGTLETGVFKNYLGYRVSESLRDAAELLSRGRTEEAREALEKARGLLLGIELSVPELSSDRDVARDVALLDGYLSSLSRVDPNYLRDSLFYASALKRLWIATS